jgi:hypothetical protein
MKKFILTEQERHQILNLYKEKRLIIEGVTPTGFVLNLGNSFPMGYYSKFSPQGEAAFSNELVALTDYLTKNKNSKFVVNITAGESKVTNKDNEHGGKLLPEGDLAKKRAESVKLRLIKFFESLKTKGIYTQDPKFSEPVFQPGKTEYPKDGTNQEKQKALQDNAAAYKKEQFVNVTISILNNPPATSLSEIVTYREYLSATYVKYFYGVDKFEGFESYKNILDSKKVDSNYSKLLSRNEYFGTKNEIVLKNSEKIKPFRITILPGPIKFQTTVTIPQTENVNYKPTTADTKTTNVQQNVIYSDTYRLIGGTLQLGEMTPFEWSFAKYYIAGDDEKYGTDSWSRISNKPEQINDIKSYF